jgi:methionine-rich copper-binding protein CopC
MTTKKPNIKTIMNMIKLVPFRLVLAAILFLAVQSSAWAHAFLDYADPKVGSTVTNSPPVIKIWFTQQLEPVFSSIMVQDEQGKEVDKKDMHLDDKHKTLLILSLPHLSDGTYTVTWHVVSVDTHRTQGSFKFTIKTAQK